MLRTLQPCQSSAPHRARIKEFAKRLGLSGFLHNISIPRKQINCYEMPRNLNLSIMSHIYALTRFPPVYMHHNDSKSY